MRFWRAFRRNRRAAVPAPASNLKYSDYAQGAAIVTGVLASSEFLQGQHPELVGYLAIATTALAALSQWLQSKGD